MIRDDGHAPGEACASCVVASGRRVFLRDAAIAAAMLTVCGTRLLADPVRFVGTLARNGAVLSYTIPGADGAHIDMANEVILVRWQSAMYAFNLACPHQNTALKWDDSERRFQCPKHHSRYEPDGTFIDGRATRGMDRFAISHTGASVAVDVDKMYRQDKDAQQWAAAVVHL